MRERERKREKGLAHEEAADADLSLSRTRTRAHTYSVYGVVYPHEEEPARSPVNDFLHTQVLVVFVSF